MREDEFRAWLKSADYKPTTVDTKLTDTRRIELAYGDLDAAYDADRLTSIRQSLTYSKGDEAAGRINPSKIEIDGNLYGAMSTYRSVLATYARFRDDMAAGRKSHPPKLGDFAGEVSQMMSSFKERMPDFRTFEAEEGAFWEREGQYKRETRDRVAAMISTPGITDDQCGRDVFKALGQGTAQGLPLSWRTAAAVGNAPTETQTAFYTIVARLARLKPGDLDGLLECARALEALKLQGLDALKRGEVLGIVLSVYGTVNPNDACWFKVRIFDRLGKRLTRKRFFPSSQFEIAEFIAFQDAMNRIRDQLDDGDWRTTSLMDVQGFIWVVMDDDYAIVDTEGLSRDAVEQAMDECQDIGLPAFLGKYGFGHPRDYWVRRDEDETLYPAKATVGAAYGFMPGGKSQTAKEFHAGFGEQAANSILKRLGFEIVTRKGGSLVMPEKKEPQAMAMPTNLILYGPPGTGKTYATARKAVELCGETAPADRDALMSRYRALQQDGRIAFVTFHQSYSYEDFVEGLRPETGADDAGSTGFRLEPRPGVFREICALAEQARTRGAVASGVPAIDLEGRRFWKMGQGAIGSEDDVYDDAVAGNYIALGWGGDVDWSDAAFASVDAIRREWQSKTRDSDSPSNWTQLWPFRSEMKPGDIVIVPYGNSAFRAVAEVTGDYYHVPEADGYYAQRRPVRWLLTVDDPLPLDTIIDGKFTMRTLYALSPKRVNTAALARLLPGTAAATKPTGPTDAPDQFVLIIDEINRANISKVFGELITLLEPNKRLGMPDALTVTLPYSKKRDFGVPANLHIVGTMNTADRSIAHLDTALRRRFEFIELMPDPEVLAKEAGATGVDLPTMLRRLNERVEYLFDREHQIGHAYFIGCISRADLDDRMRHRVIPLLAEYFHEDMAKVAAVLGDNEGNRFLTRKTLKPPPGFEDEGAEILRWSVRSAFSGDAYAGLM